MHTDTHNVELVLSFRSVFLGFIPLEYFVCVLHYFFLISLINSFIPFCQLKELKAKSQQY